MAGRAARGRLAAAIAMLAAATPGLARAQTEATSISLRASPAQSVSSQRVILSGTVSGGSPGSTVALYGNPYPFASWTLVGTTAPASDGSFQFTVFPDRDTRYQAIVVGTTTAAMLTVNVSAKTVTKVKALTLGRARVRIIVFHPSDLRWNGAKIYWKFGSGRHGRFRWHRLTRTRRLSPYATLLSATVTLSAGRFRWRACFHAPDANALVDPGAPRTCSGRGYQGTGHLPVGFPRPAGVARAARYLRTRVGRTAFAVVDTEGRMSGVHVHWTFQSASVAKAMLLVAYLRRLQAMGQHRVDPYSNSFLYPMIHVSDNSAATQCWSIVGDGSLYSVAYWAGMTDFSISGIWANARISAADQAKFFFEMASLIPHAFVGYARYLFSTIAGYESWGITAVARPRGYAVFFKGGWIPPRLVHQVARLERRHHHFAIAVLTDGDPSMGYGVDTIQGVTAALL